MAAVLPWTAGSPVLALALVVGAVVYLVLVAWGHRRVRALLLDHVDERLAYLPFLTAGIRRLLARAASWTVALVTLYVALYALTWVWAPLAGLLLAPAVAKLPSVLFLAGLLLAAGLALEGIAWFVRHERDEGGARPRRVSPQALRVVDVFLRYVVYTVSGVAGGAVVLGMVGYRQDFEQALLGKLSDQAGAFALLALLVGAGWAGGAIIRAVASDVRRSSRRFSPEVVDAMGAAARGALYAILGLVGTFTALSAVGLGAVAGTLVVVMSSFIGLVVAMAATGSIGNALAGVVLLSFKPIARGERVVLLDDTVADVEEVGMMFTRVRTLAREVVEVPNNLVLSRRIKNLSRSGPHAIVVRMGIGYDVPAAEVQRLAVEAATRAPGILPDPAPRVYAREFASFAIEYELHAFTSDPRHLQARSDLLALLQEAFAKGRVEILTPDVFVVRRGQVPFEGATAIPVEAREKDAPAAPR